MEKEIKGERKEERKSDRETGRGQPYKTPHGYGVSVYPWKGEGSFITPRQSII